MEINEDDKFDQLLSKALEKEPAYELPRGFADRIVAMTESRSVKKETSRDKWWLIAGIAGMIGTVVFVLTQVKMPFVKPTVGVFTFFQGYSGLVIFGILFVIVLHLVDKLVLSKKARIGLR